jgi:TRAP-type C4-dicarboxylate transport system permease large subunit
VQALKVRHYPTYRRATLKEFPDRRRRFCSGTMTPFIIVGGILLGWFTATNPPRSGYTGVLSIFFYREMDAKLWGAARTGRLGDCAVLRGNGVGFRLAARVLRDSQGPARERDVVGLGLIGVGFFIAFVFLVVGCFLDAIPAIIIVAPRCSPWQNRCTCIRCRSRSSASLRSLSGSVTPRTVVLMISCAIAKVG